ncbi:MAG: type IV pilin protein [Gemmatimonadales bacterium]
MNHNSLGFSSAEMVVGLLTVGVLAGAGLQGYAATRARANIVRMVDDLRNLANSEEGYFADHATYYGGAVPSAALAFVPSAGVTMIIDQAGPTGWSATAVTTGTRRVCKVFYGKTVGGAAPAAETQAACTR